MGTFDERKAEIIKTLSIRKFDIAVFQEVSFKKDGINLYELVNLNTNGIRWRWDNSKKELMKQVIKVKAVPFKILKIELVVNENITFVILAYGPRRGNMTKKSAFL